MDLIKELSDKIKGLPESDIREVIEFLKSKKEREKKGSPEVILKHGGSWKFQKGKLDSILKDVQKLREIEK